MDPVVEIKARLPIDELVRQYCALQKKGRNFVCLCPFHNDKHPSMLVSPDKGIAYCFPCQKGGDIFNFYQLIEGVDFPQALKDLAEKTGVQLPDSHVSSLPKDEKERMRAALEGALASYQSSLRGAPSTLAYLQERGVTDAEIATFELGLATSGSSDLYETLLKKGFSRAEIVGSGMAIQRDLSADRPIDRFRNRLMFPIRDALGRLIGFGGRTLGGDDAKYVNSAETPLYRKASVLYGFSLAKDAIRERKRAVLVEGYFDVLACHRVGITEAVAACGTSLTEEHARLLKRHADIVVLCLDQDAAGRAAAERAFAVLAAEGVLVQAAVLPEKDPADLALHDPEALKLHLTEKVVPYIDYVIGEVRLADLTTGPGKRAALQRLLPLLAALPTAVERSHYVASTASALGVPESAVEEDLNRLRSHDRIARPVAPALPEKDLFDSAEIALGFFMIFPQFRAMLPELIPPATGMAAALYEALRSAETGGSWSVDDIAIPEEYRDRVRVLSLYCENHGFSAISESLAIRELKKNCRNANRDFLHGKIQEIAAKMRGADKQGNAQERSLLQTEFEEVLKLTRRAG